VLIGAYVAAHAFAAGYETEEAVALWAAAVKQGPRIRAPFDPAWFADLLAQQARASIAQRAEPFAGRQDWGEAPAIAGFVGRNLELSMLRRWISDERCRVVTVLGIGGIGKTMLAAQLADNLAPDFERVYWRSLRSGLTTNDWLAGAIAFVSDHQAILASAEAERTRMLLDLLRQKRSLLVLDNLETVLEPRELVGRYHDGYGGYGTVIQQLGESSHQSCLLMTCREAPPELGPLQGEHAAVRSLELGGLDIEAGRTMLVAKAVRGDEAAWTALINLYGGNGLALKIAGEAIARVFGGDIAAFLSRGDPVFGGIQQLLEEQLKRLSDLELSTLRWFALDREPVDYAAMSANLSSASGGAVIEAIEALRGRSLLAERRNESSAFSLQSVVLEHITEQLVDNFTREIATGEPDLMLSYPMVKATAQDYVRRSQERLMGTAVLARLTARLGTRAELASQLAALLASLRRRPRSEQRYGPGNLVNLLRLLHGDLRGLDLSELFIRQAYLADVDTQDTSLADAVLSESVLAEAFAYPVPVVLSHDGTHLATGTASGELRMWRVSDRAPILSVPAHAGVVQGLALSADGRVLASASQEGIAKVWESGSGRLVASMRGSSGGVWSVALTADGLLLASGGLDGNVRLWDISSGACLATLEAHTGLVFGVALSADGRLVASGGADGMLQLWESSGGRPLMSLRAHSGAVWAIALSRDGRLLVSGDEHGAIKLWQTANGRVLQTLQGHSGGVWALALSGNGLMLASGGADAAVKLWDVASGECLINIREHTSLVRGVALSGDGRLLGSGSQDGTVRLWEAPAGRLLATIQGQRSGVWAVAMSGDGRLVAGGCQDGAVRLWETASGRRLAAVQGHHGLVRAVALNGDGRLLASGYQDGTVALWETSFDKARPGETHQHEADGGEFTSGPGIELSGTVVPLARLQGHSSLVRGVALSWDGRLLASGGLDGTVRLWDTTNSIGLASLTGQSGGVWSVALSWDGRVLVSGEGSGAVKIWDVASGERRATLQGHRTFVFGVALSGDGRLLASGGLDRIVKVWEVASGQCLATLHGHKGQVLSVALSGDGRLLASGSEDGAVKLWNVPRGECVATFGGHSSMVYGVALSGDGRLLASGGLDGTVRLRDSVSGAESRVLRDDRPYERMDITGLAGVTEAQRQAMLALGALEKGGLERHRYD
jgi:WD40 repeat protein